MSQPKAYRVWSDEFDESISVDVDADSHEAALLFHLAEDWVRPPANDKLDDYLVRLTMKKRAGPIKRFRVEIFSDDGVLVVTPLRTCRKCGCTDDRACADGCSWVGVDQCSECFP